MLVYLGLGANVGEPRRQLAGAVRSLRAHPLIRVLAVSSLYRSAAAGNERQPDFTNAVVAIETDLGARALLDWLKMLEQRAGRRPGPRHGPRPLDLDVLVYGNQSLSAPGLQVPHPRLTERTFVLAPLAEIAPRARVPGTGRTAAELAAALPPGKIWRLTEGAAWLRSVRGEDHGG